MRKTMQTKEEEEARERAAAEEAGAAGAAAAAERASRYRAAVASALPPEPDLDVEDAVPCRFSLPTVRRRQDRHDPYENVFDHARSLARAVRSSAVLVGSDRIDSPEDEDDDAARRRRRRRRHGWRRGLQPWTRLC